MNKRELRAKVKENLKYAQEQYEKNDGNGGVPVMLITETSKNGKRHGAAAVLANEGAVEKRRDVAFDLGIRAGIELSKGDIDSIDGIFMISEAWYSAGEKDAKPEDMKRPSEDPNKKEAIVSTGMLKNGETAIGMFELKRSFDLENGRLKIDFEPLGDEFGKGKGGSMESPLLKQFWNGVSVMEKFGEVLPPALKDHMKVLTTEKIFEMFMSSINQLRAKHGN